MNKSTGQKVKAMSSISRRILLLFLAAVLLSSAACGPVTVAYVVRHAEKLDNSFDTELHPDGHRRAQDLARRLRGSQVDAIFVTNFKRTQQTAAPTALEREIEPIRYDTVQEVVNRVRRDHREQGVLIVGHSNTVHRIVAGFGATVPEAIRNGIPEDEYDNLVIMLISRRKAGAALIKY